MSYSAPAGNAVDFDLTGVYTAPAGSAVDFAFAQAVSAGAAITLALPAVQGRGLHDDGVPAATTNHRLPAPPVAASALFVRIHAASAAVTLALPGVVASADFENARLAHGLLTPALPVVAATALRGAVASAAVTLAPAPVQARGEWGIRVPAARLAGSTGLGNGYRWGRGQPAQASTALAHNDAPSKAPWVQSRWQAAGPQTAAPRLAYGAQPAIDTTTASPWQRFGAELGLSTAVPVNHPWPADVHRAQPWADFGHWLDRQRGLDWMVPPPKDEVSHYRYQRAELWQPKPVWDTRDYTPPPRYAVDFAFDQAGYTAPAALALDFGWGAASPYPNQPIRSTDPGVGMAHQVAPALDKLRAVVWGAGRWTRPWPDYITGPGWHNQQPEPAERPPLPLIQGVYVFMPTLTLYRLPDGAELQATNVSWSTDADSWAWQFSATLVRPADLALVKPDSNGPREIGCDINGHTFTALVRGYAPSRQFGETRITINGISRAGWLAEPHAPKRSRLITAPYSARQLAELELANTGFTLDWQAPDWQVPASVFGYEGLTPISAIKRIAEAAGAVVQSHPADKQLIVRPRYPVSPHKWTDPATAIDAILPASLITQLGAEFTSRPAYNRAITAGGPEGGVIVTLTRDGTAGDVLAPVVTDDLITDQAVGYERGRNAIAEGGSWEQLSLATRLLPPSDPPGLLLPGHLIEVQDLAESYPALVTATGITAASSQSELTVRQTLTAERSLSHG